MRSTSPNQRKCPVASSRAGRFNSVLGLERSDVFCLEAFRPLGDVELDRLTFLQAAKTACLNGRKMHENIVAGLAADKAEALGIVKPLHCSLFHCVSCFYCFEVLLRRIAAGQKR